MASAPNKSLIDLMTTIIGTPCVDAETKLRAGFLLSRFKGDDPFAAMFGAIFGPGNRPPL